MRGSRFIDPRQASDSTAHMRDISSQVATQNNLDESQRQFLSRDLYTFLLSSEIRGDSVPRHPLDHPKFLYLDKTPSPQCVAPRDALPPTTDTRQHLELLTLPLVPTMVEGDVEKAVADRD